MRRQARREMLGLQQGKGERTEHLRSLSQDARHDPCVLRRRRDRIPADGFTPVGRGRNGEPLATC